MWQQPSTLRETEPATGKVDSGLCASRPWGTGRAGNRPPVGRASQWRVAHGAQVPVEFVAGNGVSWGCCREAATGKLPTVSEGLVRGRKGQLQDNCPEWTPAIDLGCSRQSLRNSRTHPIQMCQGQSDRGSCGVLSMWLVLH